MKLCLRRPSILLLSTLLMSYLAIPGRAASDIFPARKLQGDDCPIRLQACQASPFYTAAGNSPGTWRSRLRDLDMRGTDASLPNWDGLVATMSSIIEDVASKPDATTVINSVAAAVEQGMTEKDVLTMQTKALTTVPDPSALLVDPQAEYERTTRNEDEYKALVASSRLDQSSLMSSPGDFLLFFPLAIAYVLLLVIAIPLAILAIPLFIVLSPVYLVLFLVGVLPADDHEEGRSASCHEYVECNLQTNYSMLVNSLMDIMEEIVVAQERGTSGSLFHGAFGAK